MRRTGGSSAASRLAAALLVLGVVAASLAASVGFASPASASTCASHVFTSSNVAQPTSIVTGPDGNLWFTSSANDRIGRIDPDTEQITTFTLGVATAPVGIVSGPDGNLWFTAAGSDQVGRITPAGTVMLFPLAANTSNQIADPQGITVGPDDRIWFTNAGNDQIGVINPATTDRTSYGTTGATFPLDITAGPDGNIWYAAAYAGNPPSPTSFPNGRIIRMSTSGSITGRFEGSSVQLPSGMAAGPDGNVWATSILNASIVRVTPAGALTAFTAPDVRAPQRITVGPDGALWFAPDNFPGRVGRITTSGTISTYSSGGNEGVTDVEAGPDGNVWFVGQYDDTVGYVDPDDPGPRFADITSTHPFCFEIDWMDGEGISTGYPDRSFRPADKVTRQAMSAFLYRLAGTPAFADPATPTFGDVSPSNPFFTEVEWMAAEGISTGTPASPKPLYKPSAAVSRGAMSAFMYRLADPQPPFAAPLSASFGDVSTTHPFFPEIEWMASEEITTGYLDGTFKPAAAVTRQAMSAFMYRLAPLLAP